MIGELGGPEEVELSGDGMHRTNQQLHANLAWHNIKSTTCYN
jgi:hypothetical protein